MKIFKTLTTLITIASVIGMLSGTPIRAAGEAGTIDWESQGFERIKATAYCVGHHTAMGIPVHNGVMATSAEHLGDVAIVYTTDGIFLSYYYCCDQGGTDAIRNGYVIDIYRSNYEQCKAFMKITKGEVYVKYIEGDG